MLRLGAALGSALLFATAPAYAAQIVFNVPLLGSNEVGGGDPDGSGTAILTIDDVALTIDWNITVANLDTVILDHIHSGAAGTNGPVVVDFGGQLSGSGLQDNDLANVLANPSAFYVNVHTNTFQNGAIRGQVPEPDAAHLIGLGAVALGLMRRKTAR